jgi:hypothetical protein
MSSSEHVTSWNPDDLTNPPCTVTPEAPERAGMVATPYGDLRFLNVSGTLEEMAVQLGTRTRDEAHLGPVPFFANHLERVFRDSPVKRVARILDDATYQTIGRKLRNNIPEDVRRSIQAYARVTELDLQMVWRAYLMPEIFLWVLGTYHRMLGTKRASGLGRAPMFGCTSAITVPPRSGTTLHGRNFDYFGADYWDRFATVVFYHPDDGLDYVATSSAGMVGGGITAMNSAGLTFAVHQHFPDRFDLSGVPVGIAGDRVMRQARTIEDAVAVLRDHPPVSGWTYVMTEGDTGRAAVYEVAPGKEHLHFADPDDGALGYANVYWGRDLRDVEIDYYPEYRRCNYARQERVRQCLVGTGDEADPRDIARILGDFEDPRTGRQRLLGPTITSVHTVASVVFEPERRRVWVGAGRSPACRGWFIPFGLESAGPRRGGPDFDVRPFIPYPGWHENPAGKSFEFYRQACVLSQEEEPSDDRLLVLVEHALALKPDEPYLRVLAGLVALRLGRGRRAEGAFRRALEEIERPDRRAEVGLFLAWSLDLQKQRGAAKHLYKTVLNDTDADDVVRSRARYGRWFRFDRKQARRLNIDFTYGGVP